MSNWINKFTGRRVRLDAPNPGVRTFDMIDRNTGKMVQAFSLAKGEQLRSRMSYLGYVKVDD